MLTDADGTGESDMITFDIKLNDAIPTNLGAGGPARTLGGCRVAVRGGRLRVTPEMRAAPAAKGRARAKNPAAEPHQPLVPGIFTVAKLNVNIM